MLSAVRLGWRVREREETMTDTDPRLRRRDLAALELTEQCRSDIAELERIRIDLDQHNADIAELNKRRLAIWKRRLKKGDLKKSELARLSGVTPIYVDKVVSQKSS
jgi:hypothetical protein